MSEGGKVEVKGNSGTGGGKRTPAVGLALEHFIPKTTLLCTTL